MTLSIASLDQRLRRIEDREAIRVLIGKYCLAIDNKDFDMAETLFTPDARFGWKDGSVSIEPREAVMHMYRTRLGPAGPSFHFTHDQFVEWDDADDNRATGLVACHAETYFNGVQNVVAIRYEDKYARQNGRWLFRERVLCFLYNAPFAQYDGILGRKDRIVMPAGNKPAHWP
jgi:hypothetical protein